MTNERKELRWLRGLVAERDGHGGDIPVWLALEWIDDAIKRSAVETPAEPNLEAFDMRASYDAAKGLEATATFKGDAVKEWCKIAVDWFREVGGKGFVVMDMTDPRDGEHYTLTVQRAGGKTAAQEITELKAQLAALQPSETSGWQPIETAPKGGKWVLLWWPRITDCAVVGYYSHKDCWCSPIGSWEGYLEGENFPGPTHWQPLPPPVKATPEPDVRPCNFDHYSDGSNR